MDWLTPSTRMATNGGGQSYLGGGMQPGGRTQPPPQMSPAPQQNRMMDPRIAQMLSGQGRQVPQNPNYGPANYNYTPAGDAPLGMMGQTPPPQPLGLMGSPPTGAPQNPQLPLGLIQMLQQQLQSWGQNVGMNTPGYAPAPMGQVTPQNQGQMLSAYLPMLQNIAQHNAQLGMSGLPQPQGIPSANMNQPFSGMMPYIMSGAGGTVGANPPWFQNYLG